jgi:hypothetical protein
MYVSKCFLSWVTMLGNVVVDCLVNSRMANTSTSLLPIKKSRSGELHGQDTYILAHIRLVPGVIHH